MSRPLLTTVGLVVLCLLFASLLTPAVAALATSAAARHCCDSCPASEPAETTTEGGPSCGNCPSCAPCDTVHAGLLPAPAETRLLFAELQVAPPPLCYRATIDYPPEAA